MKSIKITITLLTALVFLIGFGIGQIYGITKAKPKYDCMRAYYAGMDMTFCGPTIKCSFSEDQYGQITICRDTRSDK